MGAGLVVVLVIGVTLAACGGGAETEGESLAPVEATATEASSAGTSSPVERSPTVTRTTSTPSGTDASSERASGTESVGAISEPAESTQEASARVAEEEEGEYDIYSVIPRDRIPAILDPEFLDAAEAIEEYNEHEQVLGLSINGDHRAYPLPFLSQHEIVNDVVGGKPVAVTW